MGTSMYPRQEGALELHETFRYGNETSCRHTFGDTLADVVRKHTEIEPDYVLGNLVPMLSSLTLDGPAVEFGWSTYTLRKAE